MITYTPTTRILFYRRDAIEVCRYTSLDIRVVGSLWVEAWASAGDIETLKRNNWWFDILVAPIAA